MRRRSLLVWLALAWLPVLASCGGSTPAGSTTPDDLVPPAAELGEPPDLRDLVDRDVPLLAEANVDVLRQAWFYGRLAEVIQQAIRNESSTREQELIGILRDIFDRTSSGLLAFRDRRHATLALRGQYTPDDLRRALALRGDVQERAGDGFVVFVSDEIGFALLRDHTIVVAALADLEPLLDRYTRRVRGAPPDETVAGMLEEIASPSSALSIAARLTRGTAELFGDGPDSFRLAAEKLSAIGFRIEAGDGIALRLVGRGPDPGTVAELARGIQAEVDAWRRHPGVVLLGLRGILGAIRVEARESTLDVSLALAHEQIDSLLRSAAAFVSAGD